MTPGYYRFPTIQNDQIVFVSEDDLWSVPTSGGVARRLTSNLGEVSYPALSPDGAWLAFVGKEEGASEVYLMPATGGAAQRLTYLSSICRVVRWSPDGQQIIFSSNYGQVVRGEFALFALARTATNGAVTPLPYGAAHSIAYGPDGQLLLGRNTGDAARWKRYRGGTAGELWIDRTGEGNFTRILRNLQGQLASPMWLAAPTATALTNAAWAQGGRLFFVADHEGVGNLYSCLPASDDSSSDPRYTLLRHTDHDDYYVRNPATDGQRIVYHAGADLYVYDAASDQSQRVEVAFYSPRVQRNRKFVDAARYLDSARLHPAGKALTVTTRGKLFGFYNHDGPVLQLGARDGVRYRLPEWLKDGHQMIVISDETGEEVLEIRTADPEDLPRRIEGLDIGRVVAMKASPVQNKVALSNHRQELFIMDVASGTVNLVDRSPYRLINGFDWSPDGRWLAYSFAATAKTIEIRLHRLPDPDAKETTLQQGSVHTITLPVLHDVRPAFDPEGRYLYFLSYREFNPVYDTLTTDLNFPWGMRPYLITLRADLPNPFTPHPELEEEEEENKKAGPDEEDAEDEGEEIAEGEDGAEDGDEGDAGNEEGDEGEDAGDEGGADDEGEGDEGAESDDDQPLGDEFPMTGRTRKHPASHFAKDFAYSKLPVEKKADEKEPDGKKPDEKSEAAQPKPKNESKVLRIDLDGIERRVIAFPVPDGRYGQIAGIGSMAFFTFLPVQGLLDNHNEWDDEEPESGTLRSFNFKEYKTETIADNVSWFDLSRNRKKLLYASGRRLRVINAGEKTPGESGPGRRTGWVELNRIKVSVTSQHEWEQMFREAWRLQRDHFWNEAMSDVDWQIVFQRYFPLIERISTRGEFSDLMWEMQGELGTSHAYEYDGHYRWPPYFNQGFLGATLTWEAAARGYRISDLIVGDPWEANTTSPLAAPGVDIQPGDLLLAINGQRVDEKVGPAQLLVNQANNELLLTLAPRLEKLAEKLAEKTDEKEQKKPETTIEQAQLPVESRSETSDQPVVSLSSTAVEAPATVPYLVSASSAENAPAPANGKAKNRSVVVRAMAGETGARYRAWINHNRAQVHTASNGRVGYVHIPDMQAHGYAEFHRGYLAEVVRDALIVDVRYNGGGHVSPLILEKLTRRRIGYDLSRWGGLAPYPHDSVAGPLVALTNEHAGSDGDVFCHAFKLLKLGPLIGKRTWGGVVGISPQQKLVDGTTTTQPEFSFWFEDVGWAVENYGTDPDIEVDITPQEYAQGKDPQLERAISEILRLLEAAPIRRPDTQIRPSRALPKLPARSQ